jgi:hypothetical protein
MPYTLAHPGFSLYLFRNIKSRVGTTGLVVGSFFPDTDILFRISNSRFHIYQYGFLDVFLIILPLSILTGLFFHQYVKPVLFEKVDILPLNLSQESLNFEYFPWFKKHYPKEIMGVILAVYLHIFLDNISHWNAHYGGFLLNYIIYPHVNSYKIGYNFALYFPVIFFTLIGFLFLYKFFLSIGINYFQLLNVVVGTAKKHFGYWLLFGLYGILLSYLKILKSGFEPDFKIDYLAISLTSGYILAFFTFPLIYSTFERLKLKLKT